MLNRKYLNMFITLIVLTSLVFGSSARITASAMPMDPKDETKVPHYFGPNPNWALSPLRVSNVDVTLTGGGGTGATATATVDPVSGAILSIDVTNPGSGYTSAPTVNITSPINTAGGPGTGALATAIVDYSGVVTGVTVNPGGAGYTAPTATFDGGGAVTQAAGIVYGGVDAAVLITGTDYSGYTMPVIEFGLPNEANGVRASGHATCVEDPNCAPAGGGLVTVNGIVVDNAGSGYSAAPTVIIRDGPADAPASLLINSATASLTVQAVALTGFGTGYTSAPTVTINDPTGTGAVATAEVSISGTGAVTSITVDQAGSGYMTPGIKKFVDDLPGLCMPPNCPTTGKYIPVAVPEKKTYAGVEADEYVIGLVQYRTSFSSSLPDTLVRGYVQLETAGNAGISQHYNLQNELRDGTKVDTGWLAVTPPQWLGPTIVAAKDRPVRIVFYNLLPKGSDGDLFLPTDSSLMGSGMGPMTMADPMDQGSVMDMVRNPMCSEYPKSADCFKDNRATLHLHGGTTPWISDGTAHQWITPAGETTMWPEGVSVSNVPDMNVCNSKTDGCQTFYYTNQQSARLLFYHDHSWGITRLNVYAGEAAGYVITDPTEQRLFGPSGAYAALGEGIPLIVQDRTFVPEDWQLKNVLNPDGSVKTYGQDPTWDQSRWGSYGDFWYHHVYMPAQNPGDPSGMSAYGRWMYGPWFWPPATPPYGPIDNPYYDPNCKLTDPTTWQYNTDPFCEPAKIPGTPNISVGMEQFNDTPIVNGIAYPTLTLEPKTYRFRMLNAANDRFFNFQWYVADASTASADLNTKGEVIGGTEVAFKASELAAAQLDPNVFPTPDTNVSPAGPEWIQIGSEGGFLPAPVVVPNQPITWITDPTRFDVGNVDLHALLLAPAERADVIVDFSQFAGKTLILYNDAPAAFPARVGSYDYYTGAPDLSPNGAPSIMPGYGPNTRTVMQVKIADAAPAAQFNFDTLAAAFAHQADNSGVFESGQHPIIVGQAAYNSAYGTNFSAASDCTSNSAQQTCDGFVRVNDYSQFSFNTLLNQSTKMTMPLQPKALHDEMNSTAFDEFGRMTANLGVEAQPPTPGAQNVTLYPFVNPATEIIDATNLPKGDLNVTPIADAADGTQIWRITHNGVDTHPIHFHLYDVQVVNRVTWDNIILPPDAAELGWKDTVRISPLEDTIVALRPIIPTLPFEVPNAVRVLNPMMPVGSTAMFNNVDPQGNPTNPIINQLVNFGWEYVYHCHILSHEEMDMMRPVSVVLPPIAPDGLTYAITGTGNNARVVLTWNDNSITETAFVIQSKDWQGNWTDVGTILTPLDQMSSNGHGTRTYTMPYAYNPNLAYIYRVVAQNTVGYGAEFPTMTAKSMTAEIQVGTGPLAPTNLTGVLKTGPKIDLTFTDNALNESAFLLERSETPQGGTQSAWVQIATIGLRNNTGNVSFSDSTIKPATMPMLYSYRVKAVNSIGQSAWSNTASVTVPVAVPPTAPSNLSATLVAGPKINLSFKDTATNEFNFYVERSTDGGATYTLLATLPALTGTGTVTYSDTITTSSSNVTYTYRVRAGNVFFSPYSNTASVTVPALPVMPTNFTVVNGTNGNKSRSVILNWIDNSNNETGFTIQRATNSLFTQGLTTTTVGTNVKTLTVTGLGVNTQYWFRIRANNGTIIYTAWMNATPFPIRTNP